MMKLYNNVHTSVTGADTVRPQFEVRGNSIYSTVHNQTAGSRAMAWFEIKGNKVYNTTFHPEGHSVLPQYEIRNNAVYTTVHHAEGIKHSPVFNIKH